jgi:hypothetical protein
MILFPFLLRPSRTNCFVNAAKLTDAAVGFIGNTRGISRCQHQARAAFCAAFITVFFIRFSPAQYKLISWPSGSFR